MDKAKQETMPDKDKLKLAEWGEQCSRLKADKTFGKLIDMQNALLEAELMKLSAEQTTQFRAMTYKRVGMLDFLGMIQNAIAVGKQARYEMSPAFEPVKPHLV